MQVSTSSTKEYPTYRTSRVENGDHSLSLAQEQSTDTKTSSSLEVTSKNKEAFRCGEEEEIIIKYTIVGESQGDVPLMYYVSTVKTSL